MMDNIQDESGEWICRCGNEITQEGFWPCDKGGKIIYKARSRYKCCAKCGRVIDEEGNVLLEPRIPPVPAQQQVVGMNRGSTLIGPAAGRSRDRVRALDETTRP